MSSFSFSPLPSAVPTTGSKNIQERSTNATDGRNHVMDSKLVQNNVQNIPFGYNPVELATQKTYRTREEALYLGASSNKPSPDDFIRAQDTLKAPDSLSSPTSIPVFFHSPHGTGGLVCGLEESTKYATLTNLLSSSWSATAYQCRPKELLCFTAENGSPGLVDAINATAQATNLEPEIVVLTPSWNTAQLKESLAPHRNVVVLPFQIHWPDIEPEEVNYLHINHDSECQDSRYSFPADLKQNASRHHCLSVLSPFSGKEITRGPQVGLQPWVQWNRSHQKIIEVKELVSDSYSSHPVPADPAQTSSLARPFVLCVDWTGLLPQDKHTQSVLGSMVLRYWHDYTKGSSVTQPMIVCDNAHHCLNAEIENPFERSLLHHLSAHTPSLTAPSSGLLLLSQSPINLPPNMLDYLSFLIIHRFSSPRWYSKLQEHFLLPPYHVTHSNSSRTSSPTPPERILDLLPHQVLLYAPEVPSSLPTQERRDDVQGEATSVSLSLKPSPYKSIFGPIQRPMHASTRLTDTRQKLGQRLLAVTFKPLDGSNKDFKDIRVARHSDVVPDSPGGSGFEDISVYPSRSSDGQHNHSSSNRHPEELSFSDRHEDNSWPWTNRHSHNMSRGGISQDEVHSPATAIGASSRLQTTTSAFQAAISRPSPRLTSVPNAMTAAFGSGSHESHRLSPSYATGRSPPSPGMIRGGLTFSPFAAPVSLGNNGASILGGMGTLQMSTSAPTASPYHQHPQYLPNAFSKDRDDTLTGGQFTRPNLLAHQPLSASSQTTNESSMSRTDTDSRDGSSNDFVDLGSMRDGISSAPQHPRDPTVSPTLTRSSGSGFTANSSNAQQGLAFKPSYADVMSLSRDHRGIHRHETAILIGKGGSSGSSNASQQVAAGKAFGSTSSTTMTDIHGDGPTVAPPAPPIYAESFFWPLLDALDKARTQVSSPHNRAQCVRHSVVGQELPPSARTRLGLTFKEYVAAAARQSIVVTGDSGDKAWIAMKEWKYPGKLSSSSSSSAGSHPLASSSGAHIVHGQQGLYHHGSRISGK